MGEIYYIWYIYPFMGFVKSYFIENSHFSGFLVPHPEERSVSKGERKFNTEDTEDAEKEKRGDFKKL